MSCEADAAIGSHVPARIEQITATVSPILGAIAVGGGGAVTSATESYSGAGGSGSEQPEREGLSRGKSDLGLNHSTRGTGRARCHAGYHIDRIGGWRHGLTGQSTAKKHFCGAIPAHLGGRKGRVSRITLHGIA